MITTLQHWLNTLCLLIICAGCIAHLAENFNKHSPELQRYGFVFTGAGAFGDVVYFWWPRIESFPFELLMHTGMALIAISLLRGRVQGWLAQLPGFRWAERRQHETDVRT